MSMMMAAMASKKKEMQTAREKVMRVNAEMTQKARTAAASGNQSEALEPGQPPT